MYIIIINFLCIGKQIHIKVGVIKKFIFHLIEARKPVDENLVEVKVQENSERQIAHEFNPDLTNEQQKKIKDEIKREKEAFVKQQVSMTS